MSSYQQQQQARGQPTNPLVQSKGKEPFVFLKDPNSIKVEGSTSVEKVAKIGRYMYQWQSDNMYELQPEDNVARMRLAAINSNNILKSLSVATLVSWVATAGHRKGMYYYPLRAYIIKNICKIRPWRTLNPFASFAVQAGIFAYALGYIGNKRMETYTYTFSQVQTPYGYQLRKLLAQVDDPKHRYSPGDLTSARDYDADFERKVADLINKPAHQANTDAEHRGENSSQQQEKTTVIPPRYQRKPRINRASYSWEEKPVKHEDDIHNNDQHYDDEHKEDDDRH
ncbi:hypothetical protein NAEGRDRAFT_79070 [Naegleria gruberi]|uniref:Uncharacterized protein n=1 Tax=Naegleria gruberi TaxID=5762 RepID=D2V9H0_NAEGR|nr:uncharacterized protein NAEGRDRAFT_79070 [Naegleria gruberi]EFC46591.1 hypothetical protein NAEGRDRAFT_79070 [Naegleria gruberi]|eukprot:XP_002679335.1 hypothetical protein NAEGRDRAFT_79070 [Naegleria gruberi strain NEG-M]